MSFLSKTGALDKGLKFRPIFFPDIFINHGKPDQQNSECGIDSEGIIKSALGALGIAPSQVLIRKSININLNYIDAFK